MSLSEAITTTRADGKSRNVSCPAHDDQQPSLTVSRGDDGRVLLYCHSGCATDAVLAASNLRMADLFPSKGATPGISIRSRYPYEDEQGVLLYEVCRLEPKGFRQRRPNGADGWIWNLGNTRRVLYRLRHLRGQREVYVPEGEKDADSLDALGLPATTNSGGAGKWRDEYTKQLVEAGVETVVVLPDNDDPGRAHADAIVHACVAAGIRVKVVHLPDLPAKGDVSDWLAAGHGRDELVSIVATTTLVDSTTYLPKGQRAVGMAVAIPAATPLEISAKDGELEEDARTSSRPEMSGGRRNVKTSNGVSQTDVLLALAEEVALFHSPDGTAYAEVAVRGHRETWAVSSKTFRQWFTRQFFQAVGKAPNSESMQSALNVLQARARFDALEREVFVRVGGQGGRFYVDLADDDWRAIEVDATGWRVVTNPPVRFRRASGMRPLPEPETNGSIEALRPFLNVPTDDEFVLAVAWILAALRPNGPYPVLAVSGEQGSAKSTFAALLRSLVDPNTAPLRALPRDDRDFFISANNAHVLAFDNVSIIKGSLADTLCRLATGGGFAARQLYTDQDEVLFDACRPVILNGIENVVERPDLADRSLCLALDPIAEDHRTPEKELRSRFDSVRPAILGGLLDTMVVGLHRLPSTRLERLPRMADFAIWVTACEPNLWPSGTFIDAYSDNRDEAIDDVLDVDPVAAAVRQLALRESTWNGTATDLLNVLERFTTDSERRARTWPRSPISLAGQLRRQATFLRKVGIETSFGREGKARTRTIRFHYEPETTTSPSSAPSAPPPSSGDSGTFEPVVDDSMANGASALAPTVRDIPSSSGSADEADGADEQDRYAPVRVGGRWQRRL